MAQALSGLRVLDVTHYVAGPFCTKLLADYGAEVIKIEKPGEGDPARTLGPFPGDNPDAEASGLFLYLNTNKRSVILDFKTEEGVRSFKELVRQVDVVVENYSPQVMPRLGLDYTTLEKINPRLVMTSISNFGQSGPYCDFKGWEICLSAMSGIMYRTGPYDRAPVKHGGTQLQFHAGFLAASATLIGLWAMQRDGVGQHIDLSIMESATAITYNNVQGIYAALGAVPGREGKRPTFGASLIPCLDGYVNPFFLASMKATWADFVLAVGVPELGAEKFKTAQGRDDNMVDLTALLADAWKNQTKQEIVECAQALRLPFAAVQTSADLLSCPQLKSRDFFVEVDHPKTGKIKYPGAPFKMSETPHQVRTSAPLIGEHNEEVFTKYLNGAKAAIFKAETVKEEVARQDEHQALSLPLAGIRVLDWTMYLAGPIAAMLLAEMGAEVIHIESCSHPDGIRVWNTVDNNPQPGFWNQSVGFHGANLNKLGLSLELTKPQGRELFLELVKTSDVVIANWSPRVTENCKLDYPNLKRVKKNIIMVSSSGFGHTGPYRDYVSVGTTSEVMCGLSSITGYQGRPTRCCLPWPDEVVPGAIAFAIMAALQYRRRTGKGQFIDLSQYEAMVATVPEMIMDFVMNKRVQNGNGNRDSSLVPQGCYRCRGDDSWVVIAISNDEEWRCLCQAMEKPGMAADERFLGITNRQKHHDELDRLIENWTRNQGNYEVMYKLQRRGVPAAPVLNARELFIDQQLKARSFYKAVTHGEEYNGRKIVRPYPNAVWKMSRISGGIRFAPPTLGQHNEYVLGKLLAKSKEEMAQLQGEGIIGEAPLRYELSPAMPLTKSLEEGLYRGYDENYLKIISKALGMELQ